MTADNDTWNPFASDLGTGAQGREERAFFERSRNMTTEVRESVSRSIQRLPRWMAVPLEALVTYVSGCPHDGQRPLIRRGKVALTIEAFGGFVAAVAIAHLLVMAKWYWLLPIAWLLIAGRGWALFNIFHHATHGNLFENGRVDRPLAFASSLVSFSSSLDSYRAEHILSHHTRAMCTYDDEEAPFVDLGFPPGKSKQFYYRRLAWLILTPGTYLSYTRYRLWDWQRSEPLARRLAVWGFAAALVGGALWAGMLSSLLLAYVVPMFIIFNITGLLGTFSEHHWGTLLHQKPRMRLVLLQQGRLLLDPAPAPELRGIRRALAWVKWAARFLGYHLVVRIAVLPGDSIHHDHHHRHPRTEDWTNSSFERYDHIKHGCSEFTDMPHTHAWSLGEAIDRVFTRMAAAPPPRMESGGAQTPDQPVPEAA